MLRALFKKQMLELNAFYFRSKNGKARSRGGAIATIAVFVLLFGMIAFAVGVMADMLAVAFISAGLDWLFFGLFGLLGTLLGVFGSIFNTYAGLYRAKDNDLLLSMPIPPRTILFVRLLGVYLMGLLYESIVMVPAVIVFWIRADLTFLRVLLPFLLIFLLAFFVLTVTCALGWVIAVISSKFKNKSFYTVFFSLLFIVAYYFGYAKLMNFLTSLQENAEGFARVMKTWFYPFYHMGKAGAGSFGSFCLFILFVGTLFALTYYLMSRSFMKLATAPVGGNKVVYVEKKVESTTPERALLKKELKRFLSSPTYLLNTGLGLLMIPIATIALLIKSDAMRILRENLAASLPSMAEKLPFFGFTVMCLLLSMVYVTAPSVSLEGKSVWIAQTIPVSPDKVLFAKVRLNVLLDFVPAMLCLPFISFILGASVPVILLTMLATIPLIVFFAESGLWLNLKYPNLTWTNETIPVKQGASVAIALFGGWGVTVLLTAGAVFIPIPVWAYLLIVTAVLSALSFVLWRWIRTRGAEIFAHL